MQLAAAIDSYIAVMRAEGKASSTQYDTRMDLRQAVRFLADFGAWAVADLTPAAVVALAESWKEASPRSRSRYGTSLRNWLGWLYREGHVSADLLEAVPSFSVPRGNSYTVPPTGELRRMIESAEPGSRDRALMELLALGINPSECAGLTLADYDRQAGTLMVGKGTRSRSLELPTVAWAALTAYIEGDRIKYATPKSKGLFLNQYGQAISRVVPWNTLRYAGEVTGVAVTARMLRAARVAALLKADVDPGKVAAEVGLSCVGALRYKDAVTEGAA